MSVESKVKGHTYPPAYVVSRVKIAELARAVGATDQAHFDVEVARARGFTDVIAPPTFAALIAQQGEAAAMLDPDAGIDFARLVHGEQSFTHYRPLIAGDEVRPTTTIERVRSVSGHSMVSLRTLIQTTSDELTTIATSVVVIRRDEQ